MELDSFKGWYLIALADDRLVDFSLVSHPLTISIQEAFHGLTYKYHIVYIISKFMRTHLND